MKNLTKFICAMAAIIPLNACASNAPETEPEQPESSGAKTVVVYFSCTNTTKGIADKIAKVLECDEWRIEPEVAYTSADLDYNSDCRANREQNDASSRPAIKGKIDLSKYDVVYVGFPIWWGKMPKIMWTFFESYDLSGKTIIPFCTSGSSGISTSMSEIRSLEPKATVKDGRRFESNASEQTIKTWVESVQPISVASNKMNISVSGKTLTATLVNNSSTAALVELLKKGAVTIDMHDYGNFEKVGDLPQSLPTNDENITTQAGDLILYQGKNFVIYYDTNTWSFTRLGKIDNMSQAELKNILGTGDVTAVLSLPGASSLASVVADNQRGILAYRIDGTLASADTKGIIIQNGTKIYRR